MSAKKKKKRRNRFLWLFLLAFIGGTTYYLYTNRNESLRYFEKQLNPAGLEQVEINYGKNIELAAKTFNLPSHYLKALCMLECSGRKVVKPRFESHVYKRLKKVKDGKLSNYEHVTSDMLSDATDDALRNLASSWGPFQLMGYKCLLLNIKIADIRSDDAVYWGVKWINETYGDLLRKGRYKDAFHIHNTGRPHPVGAPKTYDPNYISKGLKYMAYFNKPQIKNLK
ncbi:MAG: hypothetical protein J5I91_03660 [Bacteroidetes bacterium]|nr:hypothetical protein [Bacteroidota bacterium]